MCVKFMAKDKSTGELICVEMVDHGTIGVNTFYSTFVPDAREMTGSFFAHDRNCESRMRADEIALNQFGLIPDWSTIKNNECLTAHAKHEAA